MNLEALWHDNLPNWEKLASGINGSPFPEKLTSRDEKQLENGHLLSTTKCKNVYCPVPYHDLRQVCLNHDAIEFKFNGKWLFNKNFIK